MLLKNSCLLLFVCASHALFAQTEEMPPTLDSAVLELPVEKKEKAPDNTVYELFDLSKLPSFPGGDEEMYKYLARNVAYPAIAKEKSITGAVILSFVIDIDGKVKDTRIVKDIGGGCAQEVARVVNMMPLWTPGEYKGQVVKSRYTLPFRFRLN